MKLYHTEWCPECEVVRQKLAAQGIEYEDEIVPDVRPFRKSVYKATLGNIMFRRWLMERRC